MQVVIKKKALEQVIKTLAEERSFHSRRYDQIAGDDRPVLPDAQVATQLSSEQLPVGNPDFLPVNKKQAAAAAAQMTQQVDPAKLQKYFAGLKKLVRKTADNSGKAMSETDLFEALRPIVLAEAAAADTIDQVISSFKSKLGMSAWPMTKKNFENLISTGEDTLGLKSKYPGWESEDFQAVIDAMNDPSWKPRPVPKAKKEPAEKVAKEKSSTPKTAKEPKAPRAANPSAPITQIRGQKLDKRTQDELERLRMAWSQAPDKIRSGILERGQHVPLDSMISGDISQIIDVFKKADLPIPKTFADSGIQISVTGKNEVLPGNEEETPVRIVKYSKPGSDLVFRDQKHTGGPIEAIAEMPDGSRKEVIFYITEPFPFDEQEYKQRFERLFPAVSSEISSADAYSEEIRARKVSDAETASALRSQDASGEEKKKRAATLQKKLSIDLATRDAVAMREEDPKKFEKLLSKLSPAVSLAAYDSKSDEEKDEINRQIVLILDKERGPYYAVGDMDYLRDIFDEDAESRYSAEGESISSTDPVAYGVEQLYESFFSSCFEPIMSYVIETMIDNNPEENIDLNDFMSAYGLESYNEFKDAVDDKDAWIDLVLKTTKDIVTKNPDSFDNVMPEFGKIRNAVESKGDLSEFEGRLKMLGIEDVGRLRSIFQYLKSPVAFMKAIKTTVQLQALKDKSTTAADASNPAAMKFRISRYIYDKISQDPTSLFSEYRKTLMAAGINSPSDLANTDDAKIVEIIGKSVEKKLSKAMSSAQSPANSPEVEDEIKQAIDDFVLILDADFSSMSDVKNPESKPALEYAKKFVTDVAENASEFTKASNLIVKTIDGILKPAKGAKK